MPLSLKTPSNPGPAPDSSALTQFVPSQPPQSQRFSFLFRIPVEIRAMILHYILVQDKEISTRTTYDNPYLVHSKGPARDARGRFCKKFRKEQMQGYNLTPSILRTCQHLFAEALPILYHENTLQIHMHTGKAAGYQRFRGLPTTGLIPKGKFDTSGVRASIDMLDGAYLMLFDGNQQRAYDKDLMSVASRFSNFLIMVDYSPDTLHLAQLRHILRETSAIFHASNVRLVVNWASYYFPEPLPYSLAQHQLRTIKAFTLLRCAKFQLFRVTDPAAIAVEEIITSKTPVVDLESFLPSIGTMLELLCRSEHFPEKIPEVLMLASRLIEAIGDFDVCSFLQARFEALSMWQRLSMELEKRLNLSQVPVQRRKTDLSHYHVVDTLDLGLKVQEDGKKLNVRLREVATRFKFFPVTNCYLLSQSSSSSASTC